MHLPILGSKLTQTFPLNNHKVPWNPYKVYPTPPFFPAETRDTYGPNFQESHIPAAAPMARKNYFQRHPEIYAPPKNYHGQLENPPFSNRISIGNLKYIFIIFINARFSIASHWLASRWLLNEHIDIGINGITAMKGAIKAISIHPLWSGWSPEPSSLRLYQKICFQAPGVSLGGSGVSIGGVFWLLEFWTKFGWLVSLTLTCVNTYMCFHSWMLPWFHSKDRNEKIIRLSFFQKNTW